jgi:hypothetical protein
MQNDIRDASTVVYNHDRIAKLRAAWGDGWHSARELFINGNEPNVNDAPRENFEDLVSFDNVNDKAYPVLLYTNGDEMVGWYDLENMYGYATVHSR